MNDFGKCINPMDIRSQNGVALILSLSLITILTVLGLMVINTSIVETKIAANQKVASQVFYAAESGLERGLKIIEQDMLNDTTAGGPWGNLNIAAPGFSVTAAYVNGSMAMNPDVRTMDMYLNGDSASGVRKLTFNNGGNTLSSATYDLYIYSPNSSEVYLLSCAQGSNGIAAVEYHLTTDDNSPYNNAIFSGTGINGKVTGNVNVAGSIYSMGDMFFQGNVSLVNNYTDGRGMDSNLAAILPNGDDLRAKIRVKGGDLTLKGSAEIGTSSSNPKGSLADIQVDQNFSSANPYYADEVGTSPPNTHMPSILDGLEASYPGISSNAAYSAIGSDYDKAMVIYKDLIRGQGPFAPGQTYADPGEAITSRGVVIDFPVWDCDDDDDGGSGGEWETGELEIEDCTASFSYLDSLGNGIEYDASTSVVTFTGMVLIDEEFEVEDLPTVTFIARGAFDSDTMGNAMAPSNQNELGALVIAGEEIEIETNFVPDSGGYLKGGSNTNSIGFIAGEEIELEGNPGDFITGFFYTPGGFEIEHQIAVAGTLIGGEFEFEQVPDVYQVPALKNYIPEFMPGGQTIVTFSGREWRRVY